MIIDRLADFLAGEDSASLSRRHFLQAGAAAGGGLIVGVALGTPDAAAAESATALAPNAFVRVEPSGMVTVITPWVEMGQGTYTSVPMLVAEELEVEMSSVRYEHAPPNEKDYAHPRLHLQFTGGSTTIRLAYEPLRRAGAAARTMLLQAAAQRWGVKESDCHAFRGEVIHAPSGRHLKYGALVADAARLPVPEKPDLKPLAAFKLIGTSPKRLDTPGKVNGTAVYGIDAKVPGMKVATLAQSPTFGGKLRSVDDSKAKAVRGVRQIVRLDDCVAVVADHMGAAKKGLAALTIEWDDGPNARLATADVVSSMAQASQGAAALVRSEGDYAGALAGAAHKAEAVYELPFLAHTTMEPMNCTVHVRPDGCEVWTGTQVIGRAQAAAANVTGLPAEKVIVHNHLLGGGFGRRLEVDGVTRAVQIARHVDGPVKVVWSREEDIRHDVYRPYFFDRISAGLDASGKPVAWNHRITGSSIFKRWVPQTFRNGWDPETVYGAIRPQAGAPGLAGSGVPYTLPNMLVEYVNHEPPIPTAFWRGAGPAHTVFVVESFMDELAALAGTDPVAYRLALLDKNPRAHAVLKLAAEKADWGKPLPKGQGRGVALQYVFGTHMAQVADVEVAASGEVRVKRIVCALDCGVVVNPDTVDAQVRSGILFGIAGALWGEITLKNGRVEQSNFHDVRPLRINEAPEIQVHTIKSTVNPGGMGETGTSALAPAVTNAIHAATGKRIRKLPVDAAMLKKS